VRENGTVEAINAEYVAFVGDDVEPAPGWLEALVSAAETQGVAAVSGTILESDRRSVHFAGRDVSFVGLPSGISGRPYLLYASQQSALVRRSAWLEVGGVDPAFAGCLEDVDLGWRLNLLGHTIALAPDALAYRGADEKPLSRSVIARRQRQVERNALAMIFKNYDDRTLERVFPAAVALSLFRGLIGSGIDSLALELAARPAEVVHVDPRLIAHLVALEDFTRQLPSLKRERERVQQQRRRSDAETVPIFGDALRLDGDSRYQELGNTLIRDLGIDEVFGSSRRSAASASPPVATSPPVERRHSAPLPTDSSPTVSIVILTALGPTHLPECLDALRRQTYPADRIEVIIVDNGSAQDPTAEALRCYPGARVILNGTNLGFARGNNVGAEAASGDYLVFLNDDTRVEPTWLEEMVATAKRRHAAGVASFIVDWSGTRVDFVDAAMNFQGKGFQLRHDDEVGTVDLEEKPLLFACGCAVMIDRAVFSDARGWDEGTFAYYEDVELGWRLNLLGYRVWLSPASKVYHKHHGTSGNWPEPPRLRLYERNSLRMLYALLDRDWLRRALPAALLLAADRALLGTPFSRVHDPTLRPAPMVAMFSPRRRISAAKEALRSRGIWRKTSVADAIRNLGLQGGLGVVRDVLFPRAPESALRSAYALGEQSTERSETDEALPVAVAAVLSGIFAFLSDIPDVARRRAEIQGRRSVTDAEVLTKFGTHWLQTSPSPHQFEHDAFHEALAEHFRLAAPGAKTSSGKRARRP